MFRPGSNYDEKLCHETVGWRGIAREVKELLVLVLDLGLAALEVTFRIASGAPVLKDSEMVDEVADEVLIADLPPLVLMHDRREYRKQILGGLSHFPDKSRRR